MDIKLTKDFGTSNTYNSNPQTDYNTCNFVQKLGVDTFGKLSQGVRPTLYNVPITIGSVNQAFMEVKKEKWLYQSGNEKEDLKFKDCVPWENKTRIATDCSRICLPVNVQHLYKENNNRPKCQNGSDHLCMIKFFGNTVKTIFTLPSNY